MIKASPVTRFMVFVAALLMGMVYLFPLWRIGLKAPQYPEGLSLDIWINKITGDVRNINVLNHYIGMSKIEPDKIPELSIFPLAFGILIGTGILIALINRRILLQAWCVAVLGFAILGLYDFYSWEYRYGHEISPDAPMQIEESYQPPLIGEKQIANITAVSWPHYGGYAFAASALLAFLTLALSCPCRKKNCRASSAKTILFLFLLLTSGGCKANQDPVGIEIGKDVCDECKMTISDLHYGGEIITDKGKVFKFDSLDCMKAYHNEHATNADKVYVLNFANPSELLEAHTAVFTDMQNLSGPMGTHLVAFQSKEDALRITKKPELAISNWNELLQNKPG